MGPNQEKDTMSAEEVKDPKFRAKIERRKGAEFIRCCPRCFSIRIRPLVSIAGIVSHEEWECQNCGYAGISIEVHTEDLEKLHQKRRETDEKRQRESYISNIKPRETSEPG